MGTATALAPVIPIQAGRKRRVQKNQPTRVALSKNELLAVLRAARAKSARDLAMILLGYKHGMRASEICGLRLDHVDIKNGSIVVERLKGSLKTVQPICGHAGEPLLDELKALRTRLKERPADGSDFLFVSQKGGQLDRTQFFRLFQFYAEQAGLPIEKRHPHVLKHSLATDLVGRNVNLAVVKQALGHAAIGSTMRYVSVSDEQAGREVRRAMMEIF